MSPFKRLLSSAFFNDTGECKRKYGTWVYDTDYLGSCEKCEVYLARSIVLVAVNKFASKDSFYDMLPIV